MVLGREFTSTGFKNIRKPFIFISTVIIFAIKSTVALESSITINKPIMRSSSSSDLPGWVHFSSENVRCFCNLPVCVSTGYMCKSGEGGCFSDLLDPDHASAPHNVYHGRHGCLESLTDKEQKTSCQNSPNNARPPFKRKGHPKSMLLCCYHDMCNHVDSPESKFLFNHTMESENRLLEQDTSKFTSSEVWFRAAIIAVPICGLVILLILLLLACRFLRTETLENSQHKHRGSPYVFPTDCEKRPGGNDEPLLQHFTNRIDDLKQTQLPLLVQHNEIPNFHCEKNMANAKLNFENDFKTYYLPNGSDYHKSSDFIKNVNFHEELSSADENDGKIYNKEVINS